MSQQKSHAAYRLAWENTPGERIPYLPLHKRDLVSAAEGNRTFVGEDDKSSEQKWADGEVDSLRINWKKFEIVGEVIVSVQRAQGVPYEPFKASEEIRRLICETEIQRDEDVSFYFDLICLGGSANLSRQDLYERSCHVEAAGGAAKRRFQWFPAGGIGHV
jgi:hypothetical protein